MARAELGKCKQSWVSNAGLPAAGDEKSKLSRHVVFTHHTYSEAGGASSLLSALSAVGTLSAVMPFRHAQALAIFASFMFMCDIAKLCSHAKLCSQPYLM